LTHAVRMDSFFLELYRSFKQVRGFTLAFVMACISIGSIIYFDSDSTVTLSVSILIPAAFIAALLFATFFDLMVRAFALAKDPLPKVIASRSIDEDNSNDCLILLER